MAVCKTMKTHKGISKFLINSDFDNESITSFMYEDGKIEVHSLKKECAPLHLESDSTLGTLNIEGIGVLLYVLTPNVTNNTLDLAIWDVGSFVGFTPKELHKKTEQKKDVKYKISMNIESMFSVTLSKHLSTSHGDLICILVNDKYALPVKLELSPTNSIDIDFLQHTPLNDDLSISTLTLVKNDGEFVLAFANSTDIHLLKILDENSKNSSVLPLPTKKSKAVSVSSFVKLSSSKTLIVDNVGHLYLLSSPKSIHELKLPNSLFGHGVCAAGNLKHGGVLAICNENHSINLYLIKEIFNSCSEKSSSIFVKPYRLLCSQYPINSISFMKGDQLAMASSANQLITFWGGVSRTFNSN